MPQLELHQQGQGRIITLSLSGDLDLASSRGLEAAVQSICEQRGRQVILDLRAVSFIDTVGVRAILNCRRIFKEADCGFWMMGARTPVRRVLEQCGLIGTLPLRD